MRKIIIYIILIFIWGASYVGAAEATAANPNSKINQELLDVLNNGTWQFEEHDGVYAYTYHVTIPLKNCDKTTIKIFQNIATLIEQKTGQVYPVGLSTKKNMLLIVTSDEIIYRRD